MKCKYRLTAMSAAAFITSLHPAGADSYRTLIEGETFDIPEGSTALIAYVPTYVHAVHYSRNGVAPAASFVGDENNPSSNKALSLVGPAPISISTKTVNLPGKPLIGFKLVPTVSSDKVSIADQGVPSNAVVIPSSMSGDVRVVLESSDNLVTWTPAAPGTYSASAGKRFFRVHLVTPP
jgi:hypothetical protein